MDDISASSWAIENPIGAFNTVLKPNQIVEPFWFGDPWTKATCFWTFGLPLLRPTDIVEPSVDNHNGWYRGTHGGIDRTEFRSLTPRGLARAMANQWGTHAP